MQKERRALSKMNSFFSKLKTNMKMKLFAYILMCVFLGLYVFSIPSFSGRAKWNLISYALMALLIVSTLTYVFLYGKFKFDKKIIIPFVFFLDAFLCTMIFTPTKWRECGSVLLMSITFVVILYTCKSIDNPRLIMKILLSAFFAFCIYFSVIPEYRMKILKLSFSLSDRLGGYFDNVNLVASYFAIGFALALYLGLINKRKRDYLYLILCLPFIYLGLFTGSRAFIFLLAILFISISYFKFRSKKLIYFSVLIAFVAALVFLIIFVEPLRTQFEKTIYTLFGIGNPNPKNIETSAVERVLWMRYGFSMGSKHLIIGLGCEGFASHSGVGTYTHNNFAELLCDFGIPGFLIFHFIIIYPFALSFVSKKEHSQFVIPFVFYFILKSMFSVFYSYKDFYLLMAFCYYLVDDVSFGDLSNKIAVKYKKANTEVISI